MTALFPDPAHLLTTVAINALRLLPVVILLTILERLAGSLMRRFSKRSARTDLGYLILTLFYAPLARHFGTLLIGGFLLRAQVLPLWDTGFSSFALVTQVLIILVLRDLLIYARHRIFHSRALWPFHAIHHSSTEVNWLSTVRFHPVEALIEVGINLSLFALLSPSQDAVLLSATLVGAYDYFIHSDIPLSYGPLNYILVSPVFHRWHHSIDREARNKNFAAMFSCIDLVGGTFFMPSNRLPRETGVSAASPPIPEGMWAQLRYPFTRTPPRVNHRQP